MQTETKKINSNVRLNYKYTTFLAILIYVDWLCDIVTSRRQFTELG